MEVRQVIDDLRFSLENVTPEDTLLGVIADRLTALRQSFPSHRPLFTPADIEFLKSLGVISDQLGKFIELKEELLSVGSLKDYEDIVSRLTRAKGALARFPVGRRVAKEIRALNERLPVIREQDEANRRFRLNSRTLDLEENPRHCPRNHPMTIREGTHGHFWGCSRYPFCSATGQLTTAENDLLKSRPGLSNSTRQRARIDARPQPNEGPQKSARRWFA